MIIRTINTKGASGNDDWTGLVFRTGWFECLPGFGAIGWRTQSAG